MQLYRALPSNSDEQSSFRYTEGVGLLELAARSVLVSPAWPVSPDWSPDTTCVVVGRAEGDSSL